MSRVKNKKDAAIEWVKKPKWNLFITDDFIVEVFNEVNWFHRIMTKILLGWRYKKYEQN